MGDASKAARSNAARRTMFLAPSSERRGGRPTDQRGASRLPDCYGGATAPRVNLRRRHAPAVAARGFPRLQEGCQAIVNSPEIFRDSARTSHSNTQKNLFS